MPVLTKYRSRPNAYLAAKKIARAWKARKSYAQGAPLVPRNKITTDTVHRFRRSVNFLCGVNSYAGFTDISGSTVLGPGLGIGVSLLKVFFTGNSLTTSSDVPSVTEFVSLFDRFRIRAVNVRIVPSFNNQDTTSNAAGTAPAVGLPIIQMARDYDDINAPSATTDLLQRTDFRAVRMDQVRKIAVQPMYSMSAANDAATGGTSPAVLGRRNFLDTTGDGQNTLWCGIKLFSETLTAAPGKQLGLLMFYVDIEYEFKTPR